MQLAPERVETHLRSAARAVLGASPTPSAGTAALIASLEPVLVDVRGWLGQERPAAPRDDVRLGAWATGRLDGPLLLATLEWAGDDPARLRRGLELHRDPSQVPAPPTAPAGRRGCAGVLTLLALALATGYALAASS